MEKLICLHSAIPLRKEASDRSEMVNQVLFGETMDVLETTAKWYLVKLHHDGYEGWLDKKQVSLYIDNGIPVEPRFVNSLFAVANGNNHSIILPAGAIINQPYGTIVTEVANEPNHSEESIMDYAKMFLEAPYLWGGRTFMGIDCSGFTQIVFRLSGIKLERDAYQQAEQGELIAFVEESETGDLAFFENTEGRITHVGIIFRENENDITIIHASGKVRIDKLDHLGIFNEETAAYSHSLRIIKRQRIKSKNK